MSGFCVSGSTAAGAADAGGGAKNKSCAASALAYDAPLWEIRASPFLAIQLLLIDSS
jgi:hypothetical protein